MYRDIPQSKNCSVRIHNGYFLPNSSSRPCEEIMLLDTTLNHPKTRICGTCGRGDRRRSVADGNPLKSVKPANAENGAQKLPVFQTANPPFRCHTGFLACAKQVTGRDERHQCGQAIVLLPQGRGDLIHR